MNRQPVPSGSKFSEGSVTQTAIKAWGTVSEPYFTMRGKHSAFSSGHMYVVH